MSIIGNAVTFGGSSGEPELLWTNPAPTSGFSAQNVIVPDEYDAYLISVKFNTSQGSVVTSYVPKNASNFLLSSFWYFSMAPSLSTAVREIKSISGGVISFGNGKRSSGEGVPINYEYGIPLSIWGVKWTI